MNNSILFDNRPVNGGAGVVITREPFAGNFADENLLSDQWLMKPEFTQAFVKAFSAQNLANTPILHLFGGPREIQSPSPTFVHRVFGSTSRPTFLIENIDTTNINIPGATITIVLKDNWYKAGDEISSGDQEHKNLLRLNSGPNPKGKGYEYKAEFVGGGKYIFDNTKAIAGQKWIKISTSYGEGTSGYGSTVYPGYMEIQNKHSFMRKGFRLTGHANEVVFGFEVYDTKGNKYKKWFPYAKAQAYIQWLREQEMKLLTSRSYETVLDETSGTKVRNGAGLYQQIENSFTQYYSHMYPQLIPNFVGDIYYGRKEQKQHINLVCFTGYMGLEQANAAMKNTLNANGFLINSNQFTQSVKSDLHPNALSYGFKFVEWHLSNNVSIKFVPLSYLDDTTTNLDLDPLTQKPKSSFRYIFMNLSTEGGDSNIKIRRYGNESIHTIRGTGGIDGGGDFVAHEGDYSTMIMQKEMGLQIMDSSLCAQLIMQ